MKNIHLKSFVFSAMIATASLCAHAAPTPSETHQFHIRGAVNYRCYAGYDGVPKFDDRTGMQCDNKNNHQTLFDKDVTLTIVNEPTPTNSPDLVASWAEHTSYMGRVFTIGVTVWKEPGNPKAPYRVRMTAHDDEPSARQSASYIEAKTFQSLNPLSIEVWSVNKKEELEFVADWTPLP